MICKHELGTRYSITGNGSPLKFRLCGHRNKRMEVRHDYCTGCPDIARISPDEHWDRLLALYGLTKPAKEEVEVKGKTVSVVVLMFQGVCDGVHVTDSGEKADEIFEEYTEGITRDDYAESEDPDALMGKYSGTAVYEVEIE